MSVTPLQKSLEPNDRLKNLPTYVFAWLDELKEKARHKGIDLIDLGIGSPDQPGPKPVVEAIQKAFDDTRQHGYPPFKGTSAFRQAVSDWMQQRYSVAIDPETEVLCLSGSKEGLAHVTMAYIGEDDISLVPEIYYPVLSRATWLVGGQVHHLPMKAETGFLADWSNVPQTVLDKARLMFLNYPNNPTGAVASLEFYESAVAFCRQHGLVLVSDLAYAEITFEGYSAPSIFQVPGAKEVAIEFHSFSKTFNMAGFRVGFTVGNPEIIRNVYALRTNMGYGTPAMIQAGAVVALQQGLDFIRDNQAMYQHRRDVVVDGFRQLGWTIQPPKAAMYVWLKVPSGFTSQDWTKHLIEQTGVVVTPGNAFGDGGEGYFRISLVAPTETLAKGIDRLGQKGIRFS